MNCGFLSTGITLVLSIRQLSGHLGVVPIAQQWAVVGDFPEKDFSQLNSKSTILPIPDISKHGV